MRIALIYDEPTPESTWVEAEYESPQTIEALLDALRRNGHRAVGVLFDGNLTGALRRKRPDLAFNIAEGRCGASRETIVPAVLEFLDIPYTGSDGVTLGVSLNKAMTKRLAAQTGVPTPESRLFRSAQEARAEADDLPYPLLVKPNFGGSSVGVGPESIARSASELPPLVERCIERYEQPCLVEEFIDGKDVTVGLLGNGPVEALPVGKVVAGGGMYGELAKSMHNREVICPCDLPDGLDEKLIEWSLEIYRVIGARDLARVDYMLDGDGNAWMLEINPLPGLSPYYGVLPVLAESAGYDHTQLIGRILEAAIERSSQKETTTGGLATRAARQRADR